MVAQPGGRRRGIVLVAGAVVALALGAVGLAVAGAPGEQARADRAAGAELAPMPAPSVTPTPTPTVDGFPQNDVAYDLAPLPVVDVFAVNPNLPVDDDPLAPTEGTVAQPIEWAAPVFADPRGEPVAKLAHEQAYGGTIVPVVEEQDHWVRVLLVGRQGVPGTGDPRQLMGWMRKADVAITPLPQHVEVSLSAQTISIVHEEPGGPRSEVVATEFAWGADATPTPRGRSFVMFEDVVEGYAYTRGHPLVYLSVQSPTLAGFGGQSVAVTAFHYHDYRTGAISNGCLRVSAETITRLAELAPGTPVYVRD